MNKQKDICQTHDNHITAACTCTDLMKAEREVRRLGEELLNAHKQMSSMNEQRNGCLAQNYKKKIEITKLKKSLYITQEDNEGLKARIEELKKHNTFLTDIITSMSPDLLSEVDEIWVELRLSTDDEVRAECERLRAELAKFFECDESDMERMTEAEWHCTRKIYHKEGE